MCTFPWRLLLLLLLFTDGVVVSFPLVAISAATISANSAFASMSFVISLLSLVAAAAKLSKKVSNLSYVAFGIAVPAAMVAAFACFNGGGCNNQIRKSECYPKRSSRLLFTTSMGVDATIKLESRNVIQKEAS